MKMLTNSVWSGGTLNVDGELSLHNTATWSGGIAVTGNGAIYVEGTSVVAANTTINVHTFDWDGFNFSHGQCAYHQQRRDIHAQHRQF